MNNLIAININNPIKIIKYMNLKRYSNESIYKSICPECEEGILFMQRDVNTFKIIDQDRCTLCGQSFRYEDIELFNNK